MPLATKRSRWFFKRMNVGELLTQTYTECPAAYFGVVAFDAVVVEIMIAYSPKYRRLGLNLLAGSALGLLPGALFGALVQGYDYFFASLPPFLAAVLDLAFIEATTMGASVAGAASGVICGSILAALTMLVIKTVRATRLQTPRAEFLPPTNAL